jgi:copper chaperone CopZ
MAQTIAFVVTGEEKMHCAGCEQRVGNALRRLAGVQAVRASADTQQVVVTFDPAQLRPEQVRAKLEQIGYEVTPRDDHPEVCSRGQ